MENPYPPTYYPGVDSAAAATEIRILPGQDASLDELRLPARLPPRPIQGRVLRADGGSIAGAYVELRMDGYSLDADSTRVDDESGRFELEGLARLDYSVSAYLREKDGTVWRGEAVVAERDAIVVLRRDE